jgi:hypothetical protein
MFVSIKQQHYFGFNEVHRHGVDGFENGWSFGYKSLPIDMHRLNGTHNIRFFNGVKDTLSERLTKSGDVV